MYSLILPLGIVNLILVSIQVLSGLKVIRIPFRVHKYFGISLCIGAFLHAAIAIIFA
jgi:hypothetical protein